LENFPFKFNDEKKDDDDDEFNEYEFKDKEWLLYLIFSLFLKFYNFVLFLFKK
jgi:hypothetical protein